MKNLHVLISLVLPLTLLSCSYEEASFSPYIQVSNLYLNPVYLGSSIVSAEDTLQLTIKDGVYVIDTISMGDKVVFAAAYGSLGNELTACRCTFDTTQLNMWATLGDDFQQILLPGTDLRQIQLLITPGYNYVTFPINYQPLRSGTYDFTLKVESDSKFSPASYTFRQPVR